MEIGPKWGGDPPPGGGVRGAKRGHFGGFFNETEWEIVLISLKNTLPVVRRVQKGFKTIKNRSGDLVF